MPAYKNTKSLRSRTAAIGNGHIMPHAYFSNFQPRLHSRSHSPCVISPNTSYHGLARCGALPPSGASGLGVFGSARHHNASVKLTLGHCALYLLRDRLRSFMQA